MLKNAYFLETDVQNRLSVGGGAAPKPLRCYSRVLLQLCQSSFLALNAVYYLQKGTNFASSKLFAAVFHFKLYNFCWQGRKHISYPRAQGTLATPLKAPSSHPIKMLPRTAKN